jgi:inorganic phosphate transporter, PiT family
MSFWDAALSLPTGQIVLFAVALLVAFAFEFINGFHDTANAVTTVIYTRSMKATPAVLYSGFLNCIGVLLGGTAVAFGIVNLLPVDLLVENSEIALMTVLSLLMAAVIWNLGTWYAGLPVSSSHTLVGSILGVGLVNGLILGKGIMGINWSKAADVGLALFFSPLIGFFLSFLLLKLLKRLIRDPRLYAPPVGEDRPPSWIRFTLIGTCGGVSFAHGANDGQKGMGLMLLVLIGFLPFHYALDLHDPAGAANVHQAALAVAEPVENEGKPEQKESLAIVLAATKDRQSLAEVPAAERWELRKAIYKLKKENVFRKEDTKTVAGAIEFIPFWVILGTALALGVGTTIGYKRIVVTVAEKIGKSHLTYAQGAAAETVAAATILSAVFYSLPVSTTQTLSSGVAGTMVANNSGVQGKTIRKILLAWVCTLPCTMLLAGLLFFVGKSLFA